MEVPNKKESNMSLGNVQLSFLLFYIRQIWKNANYWSLNIWETKHKDNYPS
jgi:hypothetical protein